MPVPALADRLATPVMLALALCELAHQVAGIEAAGVLGRVLALCLTVAVMPRFGVREWVLLGFSLALTVGLALRTGGMADIWFALGQGAYFAAFIFLLMLLRDAAGTSESVLKVGAWATLQPPGRRFVATWFGGHLSGILMNLGAISLLSPLVQRGVRAEPAVTEEDHRRQAVRERRQLSALIRGFAWVICWSPTTLTQVIILSVIPGLDPARAILFGLGLSALMLGVGWTEDRIRWGRPRVAPQLKRPFPYRAGADLLAVFALLCAGAYAVRLIADVVTPKALMTVAPLMLIGWVMSQNRGPGMIAATATRLRQIGSVSVPRVARDAYLLGAAGYIGVTAAKLAPVGLIAGWLDEAAVPAWLVVASLPVLITLGGQIALSPMMMVVFLGAVLSALPVLPAPPEYLALGLGAGWSLSMTVSPNATGALLIAGATGISSQTLTWHWNGVYSLVVLLVFAVLARLIV